MNDRGNIVIYQTKDGKTSIDVKLEDETVWLTQAQMAELFQKDRTVIGRHINNVYREGELERDITCAKDVLRMQEETGCDGFMIGRRAKGNPWIFKEILHFFETGEEMPRPSLEEVVAMMLRHGQMMIDFKGEYIGVREMRKHVAWYTFGFPGAAKLREKVNHTETYEDLEELLQNYLKATNGRD